MMKSCLTIPRNSQGGIMIDRECFAKVVSSRRDFLAKVSVILPDGVAIAREMVMGNYRVFDHFLTEVTDTVTDTSKTALSELRDDLCQICHESVDLYKEEQRKSHERIQILLGRKIP